MFVTSRHWTSILGYWQIELAEEDKAKTAFTVGPLGFYEWETLLFGLVNAPATFQRLMQQTMADIHLKECLLYIIVFSRTFDEHLKQLNSIFERLDEAGLKLKPSKCNFLQDEVKYLGHLVLKNGIRTDPSKIEALQKWPVATSTQDVRRFIGFAGFYRRFIPDFSKVAKPLHDLLKGVPSKRCKQKSLSQRKSPTNSSVPFRWTSEHQEAFQKLINLLSSTPVLAFTDFNLPFILHTDASGSGRPLSLEFSIKNRKDNSDLLLLLVAVSLLLNQDIQHVLALLSQINLRNICMALNLQLTLIITPLTYILS